MVLIMGRIFNNQTIRRTNHETQHIIHISFCVVDESLSVSSAKDSLNHGPIRQSPLGADECKDLSAPNLTGFRKPVRFI